MDTQQEIDERLARLEGKSKARVKLEERVMVGELTDKLDTEIMTSEESKKQPARRDIKKTIAWIALLAVIGAVVFPVIGQGYRMFIYSFSYYISFGFWGVAVVLGGLVAAWAIWTIIKPSQN